MGEFDASSIALTDDFVFIQKENDKAVALKVFSDKPCRFINRGERIDLEVDSNEEINISLLYWEGEKQRMNIFKDYKNKGFRFPDINRTLLPIGQKRSKVVFITGAKEETPNLLSTTLACLMKTSTREIYAYRQSISIEDGSAALSTFDGDVWFVSGLNTREVTWRRFASGLNELQSIVIKNKQIVFGRNGITRLHDRDQNGEADYFENFCNLPIQTHESREFPCQWIYTQMVVSSLLKAVSAVIL